MESWISNDGAGGGASSLKRPEQATQLSGLSRRARRGSTMCRGADLLRQPRWSQSANCVKSTGLMKTASGHSSETSAKRAPSDEPVVMATRMGRFWVRTRAKQLDAIAVGQFQVQEEALGRAEPTFGFGNGADRVGLIAAHAQEPPEHLAGGAVVFDDGPPSAAARSMTTLK